MKSKEMNSLICPCCGQGAVEEYEICEICGWENDPIQVENPELSGGANQMSLVDAKRAWAEGREAE